MKRPEDNAQAAVIDWASWAPLMDAGDVEHGAKVSDYLLAIPNGGYRSKFEAAILKGVGVKAGVSDLFLPLARHGWHGLWIEMKSTNGRATAEQEAWIERMLHAGYDAGVCYGADEAICRLQRYLGMRA